MKHILLTFAVLGLSASLLSQNTNKDEVCGDITYVYVQDSYSTTLKAGNHYFKSETSQLPLTIYYYPQDPDSSKAKAPIVHLDLTCTPGVYEDSTVAKMISKAENYDLNFPMVERMKREYNLDSTQMWYRITYDVSYRNMIYGEGVTYSIPAYVHLETKTDATIEIVSRSIATRCRDYVNTLPMNSSLKFVPEDSESLYLWQIGEWVNLQYRFLWESSDKLTISYGNDCYVSLDNGYQTGKVILPDNKFQWRREDAIDEMDKFKQSDMYIRFYPNAEGILTIEEYKEISQIKEIKLAGVMAVIDTIQGRYNVVATLPQGVSRKTILQEAVKNANDKTKDSYILYEAYDGDKLKLNIPKYTYISLGNTNYYVTSETIIESATDGDTESTLSSVFIDGLEFTEFDTKSNIYNGVEVNSETPNFTATTTSEKATYEVSNPTTVPGVATITVTAEAGNTMTYTFNVIAGRSSDATLKNIYLDGKPLEGFEAGELYYRVVATKIPTITAEVNDEKSTLEILPVKTLPGYSTIIVTAERGNQLKYSINFALDQTLKTCAQNTDTLTVEKALNVVENQDNILLLPVRDLSRDTTYLRFTWTGAEQLQILVATTCDYERTDINEYIIDTIEVSQERGFDLFKYDLRPQNLKEYNRLSADGNVYLKVIGKETGILTATEWEEDCITRSHFFDLGEQYTVSNRSFSDMYKVYAADWSGNDVRFIWSGDSPMKIWFGSTCNFNLNERSSLVIKPVLNFEAGEEITIEKTESEMKNYLDYQTKGFIYARFETNGAGELRTEIIPKQQDDTHLHDAQTFTIRGEQGQLVINSSTNQTIGIYSISGMLIWKGEVKASSRTAVVLSDGMYVVKGERSTKKIIVE